VVFGPGNVYINKTINIPHNYNVEIRKGTNIYLNEDVSIIINGSLIARGTKQEIIRILAADKQKTWGSFILLGKSNEPSTARIEYLKMTGGKGFETNQVIYTASLAAVDVDIQIKNSWFQKSMANDGINLKYSNIKLEGNRFTNSKNDALDLDFCVGEITNNEFVNAGGDAIDFSGSRISVTGNLIEKCYDKGISVGEGTTADIKGNVISKCKTGIAVKDGSRALIDQVGLLNLSVGIALYQKKQTFNKPSINVENVIFKDVQIPLLDRNDFKVMISKSIQYVNKDRIGTVTTGIENIEYLFAPPKDTVYKKMLDYSKFNKSVSE